VLVCGACRAGRSVARALGGASTAAYGPEACEPGAHDLRDARGGHEDARAEEDRSEEEDEVPAR
jgi:hypothetical protein